MMQLCHRSTRPLFIARTFALLVAVGAIIAGILAMHTLASSPAHADPTHTVIANEVHSEPEPALAATTALQSCDDLCAPEHNVVVMGCILALIAGVLIAGIALRGTGKLITHRLQAVPNTATPTVYFRGPSPPDLHVLSISRV